MAILADILWRNEKQDEAKETFKKLRELDGKNGSRSADDSNA